MRKTATSRKKPKQKVIINVPDAKSLSKSVRVLRADTVADLHEIRRLWAEGFDDEEIREKLGIRWRGWRRRMRALRQFIPPNEDTIRAGRRYVNSTEKTLVRLHDRLRKLNGIYKNAMTEVVVDKITTGSGKNKKVEYVYAAKDLHLAETTAKDMATLDVLINKTEADLISMKQRLGLIEAPVLDDEGHDVFTATITVSAPHLMAAWAERKKRRLLKLNGKAPHEEAELVNGADTEVDEESVDDEQD